MNYVCRTCEECGKKLREDSEELYWHLKIHFLEKHEKHEKHVCEYCMQEDLLTQKP